VDARPVFAYADPFIELAFLDSVACRGRWREDLDHPVRHSPGTRVVQLVRGTEYGKIGLYDGVDISIYFVSRGQANVEGGDVDFAETPFELPGHLAVELAQDLLMAPTRRWADQKGSTVDQLPSFVTLPLDIVAVGETRVV
jgi:hypothetical protein